MNRWKRVIFLLGFFVFTSDIAFANKEKDKEGSKDHPLFTRMSGYYIEDYKEKEFDVHRFIDPVTKEEVLVEGRYFCIHYRIKEELRGRKSAFQVARNYTNAIKKIGGFFLMENPDGWGNTYMKVKRGEKEIWANINIYIIYEEWEEGDFYELHIIEKAEMEQEVVADAKSLMSDIEATGRASVYGIYFDFDKADIKPESESALKEIAKLLQENKGLKLYVVGHTDNVGGIDYNMKLSKARADAVVKELVTKYKISSERLKAYGVGSLAPLASNKDDEGRAKNRRVELVEQ